MNALRIEDLRPHLGRLNWQLRRLGVTLQVSVNDRGEVRGALVEPSTSWTVKCDGCEFVYGAGTDELPSCPRCGRCEAPDHAREVIAITLRRTAAAAKKRRVPYIEITPDLAERIADAIDGARE